MHKFVDSLYVRLVFMYTYKYMNDDIIFWAFVETQFYQNMWTS